MLSYLRNSLESGSSRPASASCSPRETEPVLRLSIDGLRDTIPNLQWSKVARKCVSTVAPLYTAVRDTLHNDVEHLTQLFIELETSYDSDTLHDGGYVSELQASETSCSEIFSPSEMAIDESESSTGEPFTIHSSHPEIPSIVITPCPSQERDRSCWVPFQDASFGNRLSVPMHLAVNDVFPPLVAKPIPFVEHWRFVDGHWMALLPTLEEQMQKGMFSRPTLSRRRKSYCDARARCPPSGNARRTSSPR
ncbi:hypothetical protein QCA50_010165 [Cerrena zonata]|uniref:Uncharacterized protein n=1 Tax=Cerrena zonata TaxID=2478898 RepID=A0AAW0FZC8_9APHY